MAVLNNFLCFDLETGGYVIGIMGIVISVCLILLAGYNMLSINSIFYFTLSIGEIVVFSIYMITGILLILGTKKRDHRLVYPSLLSSFLVIISIIFNFVLLNWQYIPFALYIVYTLICILSLCQLFRDEKVQKSVEGYQPARQFEMDDQTRRV